jgi:4,5:9,10-diseco-3-hydroxy-5,9,17-trioxoandrosta-1(10),2-diene-4-oate hydrolase
MDAKPELPGFEERFAELRGCRVRYLVAGEGAPLVLVHGLGGAAANWLALAPLLLGGRRLVVPELPGHGGSEPLPAAPSLNAYADRVGLLIDEPAAVVGHSLGGAIALRLAIRRPELVSALVLAGAAGISSGTRRARYGLTMTALLKPGKRIAPHRRRVARSAVLKTLVFGRWGAADPPALPPEVAESFLSGPARHTDTASAVRALVDDDPRQDLEHVRCPVLLLWGARDNQLSIGDAFEYARRLQAPVRAIADCGHLLIGERPEACADAIGSFLNRHGA